MRIGTSIGIRLFLAGAFILLLGACQAETIVRIDVESDGAGSVEVEIDMDAEAADSIVDLRTSGLPLSDLTEAGWSIDQPPASGDDGITRIVVSKAFGTPDQFAEIMEELDGDADVFTEFVIERETGFANVDYTVTGQINPRSFDAFADPSLTSTIGRTVDSLVEHYGGTAGDVDLVVEVRLPGDPATEFEVLGSEIDGGGGTGRRWLTNLAAPEPTTVSVHTQTTRVVALAWRGVAIVAGVLAVLVAFGHLLRILRPERRRRIQPKSKKGTATARKTAAELDDIEAKSSVLADDLDTSDAHDDGDPEMIALDGMGVLYREGDDISQLLIPFIRQMGSLVSDELILTQSRLLSLGRITSSDFWKTVGLSDDAVELDNAYLSLHQLTPGVVAFLRAMRDREIRVAVITNDCARWAHNLRARHSLDGLIDPWVVSGAVGVRKPERPPYEVLRRMSGISPRRILVVDDDLNNLDAASEYGFATAWFSADGSIEEARGHQILRSFKVPEPAES